MAVIAAVLAVGALGATTYLLITGVPEVVLDRVEVSALKTSIDQREELTLNARSVDTAGRDQTENATFEWDASPADAVRIEPATGSSVVKVTGIRAGTVGITATGAWNDASRSAQMNLTIRALRFEMNPSNATPLLEDAFSLTVRVLRVDSTIAANYKGTVTFQSDDVGATLPPDGQFSASLDAGVKTFSGVVVRKAGIVAIRVTDTLASITGSVTVTGNRAPVSAFTLSHDSKDPRKITVDGSASLDPDGDPITHAWDFGDGAKASGSQASHAYQAAGSYEIRLTVRDDRGAVNSLSEGYLAKAPPNAGFQIVGVEALEGGDIRVRVDASVSSDSDGAITSYNWTWGDGEFTEVDGPTAAHAYNSTLSGVQIAIELRVTDNDGLSNTSSRLTTISAPVPPIASFLVVALDRFTRTVHVDGSASSDLNDDIRYYNWSWGDGTSNNYTDEALASHSYPDDGTFTINLTVVDSAKLTDSHEESIQVLHAEPQASFSVVRRLMHVDVDARESMDVANDIIVYEWEWGDGSPSEASASPIAGHDYGVAGRYTITLTVKDAKSQQDTATEMVSVATSTLDYAFWDFFNVPYADYWDLRRTLYPGERPVNAECFNVTSLTTVFFNPSTGEEVPLCAPEYDGVRDIAAYPYMNWYAGQSPTDPNAVPGIYAPYRMAAEGVNIAGYSRSEPVFLPVNYAQAPGSLLDFDVRFSYINVSRAEQIGEECATVFGFGNDGYISESSISLTMDLQQSKRIFGVVGTTPAEAQAWWNANVNPLCPTKGPAEKQLDNWFVLMGGSQTGVGKYDIATGFEWYYQTFATNISATVDPATGTTRVHVYHVAYGTEVLLARWFYWGNTSYKDNYLDSTKARGWLGMENAWYENMRFQGSLGTATMDVRFETTMQYNFQIWCSPGPNGIYDRTDDVPFWRWGPTLDDYVPDYGSKTRSELDRYTGIDYVHCTPGASAASYGQSLPYDYTPIAWDLPVGHTWHFEFPRGEATFLDPNLTPVGAIPTLGQFVESSAPLQLGSVLPVGYGTWDPDAMTWDVLGPAPTGGPKGSPGDYALQPWPSLDLVPASISPSSAPARLTTADEPYRASPDAEGKGPILPTAAGGFTAGTSVAIVGPLVTPEAFAFLAYVSAVLWYAVAYSMTVVPNRRVWMQKAQSSSERSATGTERDGACGRS